MGGFPHLNSSSSSFNLFPLGSIRGGANLEAKLPEVNPLCKTCLDVKMLLNWGCVGGEDQAMCMNRRRHVCPELMKSNTRQ